MIHSLIRAGLCMALLFSAHLILAQTSPQTGQARTQPTQPQPGKGASDTLHPMLMQRPSSPVDYKHQEKYAEIRTWTYLLPNGVRLVIRPDDSAKDIQIRAFSRIGADAVATRRTPVAAHTLSTGPVAGDMLLADPWLSAIHAGGIISRSGLGNYDPAALQALLQHRDVVITPAIDRHFSTIKGHCSPDELETALQLISLYFTSPRKDQGGYAAYISDLRARSEAYHKDVYALYRDRMRRLMDRADSGLALTQPKAIDSIGLDEAYEGFRKCFGNAGGFTFVITGALKSSVMNVSRQLPLIEQYLGSLPASAPAFDTMATAIALPLGHHIHMMHAGFESLAAGSLVYCGPYLYGDSLNLQLRALGQVLQHRFRLKLKESIYSVSDDTVLLTTFRYPQGFFIIQLDFRCAPEGVDSVVAIGQRVADSIRLGAAEEDARRIMEEGKKVLKTETVSNTFWTDYLEDKFRKGDDPYEIAHYPYYYRKVTKQSLQATAAWALSGNNFTKFGLEPLKKK